MNQKKGDISQILGLFEAYTGQAGRKHMADLRAHIPDRAELSDSAQKRYDILDIFDYTERLAREFQIEAAEAEPETFAWIWETGPGSPGFSDWLAQESGLFWICGKPASGKSTLMDYLAKDCNTSERLKIARASEWTIIRFFFDFRAGKGISNNFEGLLKSLLFQILEKVDDLRSVLQDFTRGKGHVSTMSLTQTRRLLEALLRQMPSNLCIFIDGLDEYQGDMIQLTRFLKTVPSTGGYLVKLCVASRPGPYISTALTHCPKFQLEIYNSSGIKRFLSSFVKDYPVASNQDKENLIKQITEKANGVFLWARFAVYELVKSFEKGENITKLSARLASLPPELEDIYSRIINNLSTDERAEASMMFRLVAFAIGDLTLEILSIAIESVLGETRLQKGPVQPETCEKFLRRIRSLTGGLIEVVINVRKVKLTSGAINVFNLSIVKLTHKTVQSYLECNDWLSNSRLEVPSPWLQICSTYLNMVSQELQRLDSKPKQRAVIHDLYASYFLPGSVLVGWWNIEIYRRINPDLNLLNFSRYSAATIFEYALTCEKQLGVSSYSYVRQCLNTSIARLHEGARSCFDDCTRYFSNPTSLDLTLLCSAGHGLALSVEQAIADGADVNALGNDTLNMALYFIHDHFEVERNWGLKLLQKILESNVHVNDANILYAIRYNIVEILELFLYSTPAGKLRLRTNGDERVGALWASAQTFKDAVEKIDLFLDRGEDVNEVFGPDGTALHAVILGFRDFGHMSEFLATASYLLERGADPNISCVSGSPLVLAWSHVPYYLRVANCERLPEMLQLLLSHGARFEPLNAAVATPSEEEMWDFCKLSRGEYVAKYKTEEELPRAIFPPNNSGYGSDQDGALTELDRDPTPAQIPAGATLHTPLRRYRKCETAWKDSKAYNELKNIFVSQILKQDGRTTKCICFGLGSPTERDPDNASMYQLAAFKSVIDLLPARQRQPPAALAQDPCFNTLDRELLSHLHISVVTHPAAFHHINPTTTFVFCPYVDPDVLNEVVSRSPAIYLGWHPLEVEPCYEVKVLMAELRRKRKKFLRLPAFEPIINPSRNIFDEMSIFWTSSSHRCQRPAVVV
ncbi:hypothetical protein EPUS_01386 [Endocarpon pusillum Z07020]|uniref:Uncharacterized protein n=1 Tax=Endocarpon pusillum (strain Z07020 / HMAS-L-300199) TaxID=1263415 RepID=U1GUC0_ENDPU|nr:uncharacterized protein EPUS_01386 [Endocarpon pusillum Z07020]ERF76053.1 hypothetical protein EPUS_01386 [Endocarpon pusillum Z07020]